MARKRYGEPDRPMEKTANRALQALVLVPIAVIVLAFLGVIGLVVAGMIRGGLPAIGTPAAPAPSLSLVRAHLNPKRFLAPESLGVVLKIDNRSERKRIIWNDRDSHVFYDGLALIDSDGNAYKATGCTKRTPVEPGESAEVEVEFEIPPARAANLTLSVPASLAGFGDSPHVVKLDRPND